VSDSGERPLFPGLRGMRLGACERTLLVVAPLPEHLGWLLDAGGRPAQQSYLRAARKLERYQLVKLVWVDVPMRVRDKRRERPLYRRSRFWRRTDRTRNQIVRRRALWATARGAAVRAVFAGELQSGSSIRWTDAKLRRIERYEETHQPHPDFVTAAISQTRGMLREEAPTDDRIVEARPVGITELDEERWLASIAAARRAGDGRPPRWEEACGLYGSDRPTAELLELAGWDQRRRPSRSPLRLTRLEIGAILPTQRRPR
jgi:hypothetical protein